MAIDSVTIVKIMNIIAAIEKFKKPYLINAIPGCNKLVIIRLWPIVLIKSVTPKIFWIRVLKMTESKIVTKNDASEVNLYKYIFFMNELNENIKQLNIINPKEERTINRIILSNGLLQNNWYLNKSILGDVLYPYFIKQYSNIIVCNK